MKRRAWFGAALSVAAALGGCSTHTDYTPRLVLDAPPLEGPARAPVRLSELPMALPPQPPQLLKPIIVAGQATGSPGGRSGASSESNPGSNGFVLNFDNTDIRDVLKAVLGEMLQIGYTVDPAVQGTISLHTATPVSRNAVLPVFEDALKVAGVALIPEGAGFEAVPLQGAAKHARLVLHGRSAVDAGYRVEIVPLKYVSATELQRVMAPLVDANTVVQVDPTRNVIILAGTDSELARADEAISLFDVDWLRSQSFGLFPLQYSQAKTIATDLDSVIGAQGPMAGLVRIVPIEHLNALLVVSPRLSFVEEMREWIARFDRGRNSEQPRLFVYRVQNGRAGDLASVLTKAFATGGAGAEGGGAGGGTTGPASTAADSAGALGGPGGGNPLLGPVPGQPGAGGSPFSDIRVTSDDTNNALLIVATPDKFARVEAALSQLDTVPLQVLLEACVAEVHLTKSLQYGLQYAFTSGHLSGLVSNTATPLALAPGGLSLAFIQGNSIQALLELISSITKVTVVSAPKLMVLNNHTASIDVGDQVPVATSSAVGVTTANAPIVNTIQQVDTGIILHVTPRVNSSGLVLMDLNQEVSSTVPTTSSSIDSPTIQQRKVASSIAVADGQTIAIGGLISDTRTRSNSGVPYLMNIPYLGSLFSIKSDSLDRTELIVLITPHVIRDQLGADATTRELREKLPLLRTLSSDGTR